jgi:hypothetical protein
MGINDEWGITQKEMSIRKIKRLGKYSKK